jgi:xanthine/uracil permease
MKKNNRENRNFLIAACLFFVGLGSLVYVAYLLGTSVNTLPKITLVGSASAVSTFSSDDTKCQKGNLISCGKELFGWDQKK